MSASRPRKHSSRKKASESDEAAVDIDYQQLQQLTKVIQLERITLLDSAFASISDPYSAVNVALEQKSYVLKLEQAKWWFEEPSLDLALGYQLVGSAMKKMQKVDLFALSARFHIRYLLPNGADLPTTNRDQVLADLLTANGQINVFPYLRQLVVDLTSRTGWPPLLLNVFRAPSRRPSGLVRMERIW